jgi:hypothetical protein
VKNAVEQAGLGLKDHGIRLGHLVRIGPLSTAIQTQFFDRMLLEMRLRGGDAAAILLHGFHDRTQSFG